MLKSTKYILGVSAVLLLVVAGAILPGELALGRDKAILGHIASEPLDEAELAEYINVSMVDKIELLGQAAGTTFVPLKTGAEYDQDTIRARLTEELDKLHGMGLYPFAPADAITSFRPGVTLYIRNDAPAISMIVWEISMMTDSVSGVFYLDDQTGKLLSFSFSGSGYADMAYTEETVKAWAAYLSLEARNVKKDPGLSGTEPGVFEERYLFGLYTGARGAHGQMSSAIGDGAGGTGRWSLHYGQD